MKIYSINKTIKDDYYLSNCYRKVTRSKIIHFLFSLIDITLMILHEIDIFKTEFKPKIKTKGKIIVSPIILITNELDNCPNYIIFLIIIIPIIIFDSIYIYLCKNDIKGNGIFYYIIINFLELFYFRIYLLFFYSFLFNLIKSYFIFAFIFSLFDSYLKMGNFLYNHLYYYVPEFIDYPYDEFSSAYDICLLISKIFISIAGITNNIELGKFFFFLNFFFQIFYCYYFLNKLIYQSYLFMKNSFLNKTKLSLFFSKTTIVFFSLLIQKKNLFTILHIFICIDIILIFLGILYFIYEPTSYIHIKNETPLKNILFYLNIINNRNDIELLIENKIINHYKECGMCDLCQKFAKYRKEETNKNINLNITENENENENDLLINNKANKIFGLFNILNDGKKKYFEFIIKLIINYKKFGKNIFRNCTYNYINLLYLIYSDYKNNDITLSLNEKIILEIINNKNSFIENHQIQIKQLLYYNEFISLIKKALNLIKEILINAQNLSIIKNLLLLSKFLKEMKVNKYKNYLFNNKLKNTTKSNNLLLACSIVYEEILNTTINNNQISIIENIQALDDFLSISNKNNNITLQFDLTDYNCKIIRAGKELFNCINFNLYDLFPFAFKKYQMNFFKNLIFTGFYKKLDNLNEYENTKKKLKNRMNNNEYIEAKLILYEKILNKKYFKLLNLKLACLFINDYNHFILLDGTYSLNSNLIISLIDINHRNEIGEKIFGVSNQYIENNFNKRALTFEEFISNSEFKISKLLSYQISFNLYNIYSIDTKKSVIIKKRPSVEFQKIANEQNGFGESSKDNKLEINIYDNNNVILTSIKNNASNQIMSIGSKKMKNDFFHTHYSGYENIKKIIYSFIISILFIIFIEYFFFNKFKIYEYNCDISFRYLKRFYRIYNQLFISILGVACIPPTVESKQCRNYISIFNDLYTSINPNDTFDFSEYIIFQNRILTQKIMDEKANIIKINDYIGSKKYNELFNTEIKYFQINKGNLFSLNEIALRFFDALLILCNSFRFLSQNSTYISSQPIYFLNKLENPFVNLIQQNEMSDYQEEVYKLILNYKYFSQQFQIISLELIKMLEKKSKIIKILVYLFLNFNIFLFLIITFLLYYYLINFNTIIIQLLNYTIMIINTKDEEFNFCEIFAKKIENLEAILEIYKVNPFECVKSLNEIYNDYNKYLNKKNELTNGKLYIIGKRNIKKKNEKFEIPKHHRIINRNDISKLNLNNYYIYFLISIIILIVIIYFCFFYIWLNFFSKKKNIFELINKNSKLEKSCYDAINMYELMIFNNYTIEEMINYMELLNDIKENYNENNSNNENISNIIFINFYQDLYLIFDLKKNKKNIGNLYQDFDDLSEFNCVNLYSLVKYELLDELDKILSNINLKQKLINICIFSHIAESKDIKTIFERHFQFIKNGMISLKDFSYEGLNKNLNSTIIGRITFFFLSTTIYIIELITNKPHTDSFNNLYHSMNDKFLLMEIVFILFGLGMILVIKYFYFYYINELCKQIFLLKKAFNICKE